MTKTRRLCLRGAAVATMGIAVLAPARKAHAMPGAICNYFCWNDCSIAQSGCQAAGANCFANVCLYQGGGCNTYGLVTVMCTSST